MAKEELEKQDELDETQDAEQASTAEQASPAEEPGETVPTGVVRELREDRRELRDTVNQLQQQVATLTAQGQTSTSQAQDQVQKEQSPIEWAAVLQGLTPDEVSLDGALYQEQQAWESRKAEEKRRQDDQGRIQADYQTGMSTALTETTDEVKGKGLGLMSLVKIGEKHLTSGQKAAIGMAGKDCGKEAYDQLVLAIKRAGGADAKELERRIAAHKKATKDKGQSGNGSSERNQETGNTDVIPDVNVRAATRELSNFIFSD